MKDKKTSLETQLGFFFAITAIAFVLIMEMAGSPDFFNKSYPVRAQFSHVNELKVGDTVKMAGVPIGSVNSLNLVDGQVEATLNINAEVELKTDSAATVKFAGLLGQNYVDISFGSPSSPTLQPNALIDSRTQPDINSIMARLDNVAAGVENLTKSFTGDSINNLLGPLTDMIEENKPRISKIAQNVETITQQVAEGEGTIGKLIADDSFYNSALGVVDNLNATSGDVKSLIDEAKAMMTGIRNGEGVLGKLMTDEKLYTDVSDAMASLRDILAKINQGEGSVGKLVNDDTLIDNAKLTLQKLDKATEQLEDLGPLSVVGTAVNALF